MKLKLNKSEMIALKGLFDEIEYPSGKDINQLLVWAVLMYLYPKIDMKAWFPKEKNSVSLSMPEAIAFRIYFTNWITQATEFTYETNLIIWINAQIDKKIYGAF